MSDCTSRRDFLARSAAGLVALGSPLHLLSCTGSEGGGGGRLARVGVQLYTVRSLMQQSVEDTLKRIAEIGYQEVEFAGYFDREPAALRATLDSLGLAAPSAHLGLDDLDSERTTRVLDAAATLGHNYVVIAWLAPEQRGTMDDWKRIAERFNRIGAAARAHDMQFAYHNHDFEFVPIDGRRPLDMLLESSDPSLVRIELDLYWITKAGGDPLAYFGRWPGRFPMVHVKESAGPPDHEMRDVGAGSIPFARLFARGEQGGIEHYFVEHDSPQRPLETLRVSYDYLRRLTF